MIKTMKNALTGLLVLPALAMGLALFTPVVTSVAAVCNPDSPSITTGVECSQPTGAPAVLFGDGSIFTTIVNILLFIIGAVSVIMLIIGGIKYTVSGGDSGQVTSAKNTILYAIIGLVIAFLAFAVVNWVLGRLTA